MTTLQEITKILKNEIWNSSVTNREQANEQLLVGSTWICRWSN